MRSTFRTWPVLDYTRKLINFQERQWWCPRIKKVYFLRILNYCLVYPSENNLKTPERRREKLFYHGKSSESTTNTIKRNQIEENFLFLHLHTNKKKIGKNRFSRARKEKKSWQSSTKLRAREEVAVCVRKGAGRTWEDLGTFFRHK